MGRLMAALLLIVAIDRQPVVRDEIALIELNHVHCPMTGRELLFQVVYWRWWSDDTHHVAEWRTVSSYPNARFRRDGRGWVELRDDGAFRREIYATALRETWTMHDPEVADRDVLPPGNRLPLRKWRGD